MTSITTIVTETKTTPVVIPDSSNFVQHSFGECYESNFPCYHILTKHGEKKVDLKEASKYVTEINGADCWIVYTQEPNQFKVKFWYNTDCINKLELDQLHGINTQKTVATIKQMLAETKIGEDKIMEKMFNVEKFDSTLISFAIKYLDGFEHGKRQYFGENTEKYLSEMQVGHTLHMVLGCGWGKPAGNYMVTKMISGIFHIVEYDRSDLASEHDRHQVHDSSKYQANHVVKPLTLDEAVIHFKHGLHSAVRIGICSNLPFVDEKIIRNIDPKDDKT